MKNDFLHPRITFITPPHHRPFVPGVDDVIQVSIKPTGDKCTTVRVVKPRPPSQEGVWDYNLDFRLHKPSPQ